MFGYATVVSAERETTNFFAFTSTSVNGLGWSNAVQKPSRSSYVRRPNSSAPPWLMPSAAKLIETSSW